MKKTQPKIEIICYSKNESMKEFTIQTIDSLVNSCLNSYQCFATEMLAALNQRYPSIGDSKWQTILSSGSQMLIAIKYSPDSFIECYLNRKHRIILYRLAIDTKVSYFSRCFRIKLINKIKLINFQIISTSLYIFFFIINLLLSIVKYS